MKALSESLPRWHEFSSIREAVPGHLHAWLCATKALSLSLQQIYPDWQLQVLSQGWQASSKTWVREIFHTAKGKKLIYARLELPEQTYNRYHFELEALGTKPIGVTLLYGNPDVTRSGFTYSKMLCPALGSEPFYWARKSTFYWHELPLSLIETFSSDLPNWD
ncbi:MAG: chorismate--pyruvate lyase [Gammaproteobacteria bacterium]|jgi:chorismate-pyruvate lyase|nr:chorismate--pyruvate lyase [Gammaproteobacteria bacterium]